jgi:predicted RNase H-like nuclease (RuvC/YqgF family)
MIIGQASNSTSLQPKPTDVNDDNNDLVPAAKVTSNLALVAQNSSADINTSFESCLSGMTRMAVDFRKIRHTLLFGPSIGASLTNFNDDEALEALKLAELNMADELEACKKEMSNLKQQIKNLNIQLDDARLNISGLEQDKRILYLNLEDTRAELDATKNELQTTVECKNTVNDWRIELASKVKRLENRIFSLSKQNLVLCYLAKNV